MQAAAVCSSSSDQNFVKETQLIKAARLQTIFNIFKKFKLTLNLTQSKGK